MRLLPGLTQGLEYLNVVMEYFDETLYSLNKKYLKNFSNMPPVLVKLYSYQLFRALNYLDALSNPLCHSIGIAHRDIKPFNILVNPTTNKVVICDFGSAKQLVRSNSNLTQINLISPIFAQGAIEHQN